jgi:hypothetical protein
MALLFPYKLKRSPHPLWSLGGRWGRPRPIIEVAVIGPHGARSLPSLLDPGADDTVFPDWIAPLIGVDLTNAPVGSAAGVGMVPAALRYAEVTLRITDGIEQREWLGRVGFTKARLKWPLLGFAGCLQFFTSTFHSDVERVELTVNRLYQGT